MSDVVTLEPKDGISVLNKAYSPATGKTPFGDSAKPSKFILFTIDWIQLQNFVAGVLRLPISQGDFVTKYGEFQKKELITNAVDAIQDLHDSAEVFGNPASLWAEWAAANETTTEKPKSLYGKIVWLAGQIMTTAETFTDTYESLEEVLDEDIPEEKRLKTLKSLLTGKGGLTDEAKAMKALCEELRQELAAFALRIGKNQKKIVQYFDQKTAIFEAAQAALKDISDYMDELRKRRDQLQKDYEAASASAAAGAAVIMFFSAGLAWPVALGVGLGLGVGLAEELRKNKLDTEKLISNEADKERKKIALVEDILGLNSRIGNIKEKVERVADGLAQITMVWDDQITQLDRIVKSTDLAKMVRYETANQIAKIDLATKKWKRIAEDTKEFRHSSLVQYRFSEDLAA